MQEVCKVRVTNVTVHIVFSQSRV